MLPALNELNRAFWTGGARGELMIQRCEKCKRWVHPPGPECPACGGGVRAEPVSGRGTIFTFTENFQQFHPDVPPPYVIAIVVLDEQDDLRLPTNLVDVDPDAIECGMRVRVLFEPRGEIHIPVFRPVSEE